MTWRQRLRHRLIWAGALLGLVLLLATVSVLRVGIWAGRRMSSLKQPIRKEKLMYSKTSLAIVAAVGALLVAAPASADNKQYGLGVYAPVAQRSTATTSEAAWIRALRLRSEALNRQYGLGAWEVRTSPAPLGDEPAWLRALRLRSEALNRQYQLGEHTPGS